MLRPYSDKYIRFYSTIVLLGPPYFRGAPSVSRRLGLGRVSTDKKKRDLRKPARLRGREILPGLNWSLLP